MVTSLVLIAPDLLLIDEPADEEGPYPFDEEPTTLEGWAKWNRHYWLRDWPGFLEFLFAQTFTEPHSTKPIEDAIGWGGQTDPQTSSVAWTRNGSTTGKTRCGSASRYAARPWSSRGRKTRSSGPHVGPP